MTSITSSPHLGTSSKELEKAQHLGKKVTWISLLIFDSLNTVSQREVLRHMGKDGYETCLFGIRSRRTFPSDEHLQLILAPIRTVPVISSVAAIIVFSIYLPLFILVKKPNYIIASPNSSFLVFLLGLILSPMRFKTILDIRTTLNAPRNLREYLNEFAFRLSVTLAKKHFDGMTTLTEGMRNEICSRFDVNRDFVGVWTSGVSSELFRPEIYNEEKIRKELSLENKFVVFYHGSMTLNRGIVETVRAVAGLKEKHKDLTLFLLGDTPFLGVFKRLAQEESVVDRVLMHEAVAYDEVPKYIAACNVGIVPLPDLPVWRNQSPLKLLEYMAMKKVVIATDIPANREVIGKSKCGIYISSADPEEIADAITLAYQYKNKLDEWGAAGRAIVVERYAWEKIAQELEGYLLTL